MEETEAEIRKISEMMKMGFLDLGNKKLGDGGIRFLVEEDKWSALTSLRLCITFHIQGEITSPPKDWLPCLKRNGPNSSCSSSVYT